MAAGLTMGLVTISTPAEAAETQTASCLDGGGVRWSSRATWGDTYDAADGNVRVSLNNVSWTTSRAGTVPTDSSVRTYDGRGARLQSLDWTGTKDYGSGSVYETRNPVNPVSAPGRAKVTVTLGLDGDGLGDCTVTFTQPAGETGDTGETPAGVASGISNLPAQAGGIIYGSSSPSAPYAHPGGLVVAGRDNYQDQPFKNVSAGGGSVLLYIDAIIDAPHGRYHTMLINASECGPATSRWPGSFRANEYGYLNDFRVGSVLQTKFKCVLEKMVAENPHMAGWFADDLGTRSWFPGFNWGSFPDTAGYRAGAIALSQTLRSVANKHGLIFLVNGTWGANDGGGYPDAAKHGNALADGGVVEHHDGDIRFFGPYGCSSQWATQSPITNGKAINFAITDTFAGRVEYATSQCYAYVNQQTSYDLAPIWGSFHATGLPSRVAR